MNFFTNFLFISISKTVIMKCLLKLTLLSFLWLTNAGPLDKLIPLTSEPTKWDESEITGYHFHTYYFQDNSESKHHANTFR